MLAEAAPLRDFFPKGTYERTSDLELVAEALPPRRPPDQGRPQRPPSADRVQGWQPTASFQPPQRPPSASDNFVTDKNGNHSSDRPRSLGRPSSAASFQQFRGVGAAPAGPPLRPSSLGPGRSAGVARNAWATPPGSRNGSRPSSPGPGAARQPDLASRAAGVKARSGGGPGNF